MHAMLDSLGQRYWLMWLACVVWATLWAFLPDNYRFVAWPVVAFVVAVTAIAVFDHLYRYAPLRRALEFAGASDVPVPRDMLWLGLVLVSALSLASAVWVLDLREEIAFPLVWSVILPGMLRTRREEVAFMALREGAR